MSCLTRGPITTRAVFFGPLIQPEALRMAFSNSGGGANPKHAGICHLGMGKNGEKWGKMGQI